MSEPRFLTVDEVLFIHRRCIEDHGGSAELRDRGLLESAIAMPASQFGGSYLHDGLAAMAAAYLFHLCKNHPFVDGNKRIALAVADVFLMLNGMELHSPDDELEHFVLSVADGSCTKTEAMDWMQARISSQNSSEE